MKRKPKNKWRETEAEVWCLDLRPQLFSRGVIVHRHMDEPGKWFVSCDDLGVKRRRLNSATIQAAQTEALLVLHAFAAAWVAELARAVEQEAD